ncbi:hypothetical protein Taro_044375 [Colocasia esculenta]|uniref:Glycosyltransferase n=1 Tax=Colocasia esculenta TaxID=4460 RepID=A0A843WY60_COLES|nr:hypothetical protein [Colocasia esculenta]
MATTPTVMDLAPSPPLSSSELTHPGPFLSTVLCHSTAAMATAATVMPHVLFVSFAGQGHLNPFLRFAKRVAAKGADVTVYTSEDAGRRIREFAKSAAADGEFQTVGLGRLRFEFFDGCGNPSTRSADLDLYMGQLEEVGSRELAALIRRQGELGRPISCVVGNPFLAWAVDVAAGMGIPCGVLWVQSCAVFSAYYHYHNALLDFPDATKPDVVVTLPGVPSLRPNELPSFLVPGNAYPVLTESILTQFGSLHKASWVLLNTFEQLERDAIAGISPLTPVIPVGPLVEPPPCGEGEDHLRGDLLKADDCVKWLDTQEPRSVVYVSVGSVVVLRQEEVTEMAEGLRTSGQPFLWVVRGDNRGMLPEGFEKETAGRGLVVGWSPQDRVLAHLSTGCFLTHCGWNSTLECLASGVPVIAFPHWGDQVTDAKFLVEVFGVGVHLRPQPPGEAVIEEEGPSFTREDVERCVEEVMRGPRAEVIRDSAAKWREESRAAMAEGGTSDRNILAFTEEIRDRCRGRPEP